MRLELNGSAFVSSGLHFRSNQHARSQWQVTSATDDLFQSPLYDSGESLDLLVHTTPDIFAEENTYLARVCYFDGLGWESDWSDTLVILGLDVSVPDPSECSVITPQLSTPFAVTMILNEEDHCPEDSAAVILGEDGGLPVIFTSCP